MKAKPLLTTGAAVICACVSGAYAQGLLTDQSLQPPPYTGGDYHYDGSILSLQPAAGAVGQEFTPSLQGLDFVEIALSGSAVGDTFQIAIHAGSITATVLALSAPVVSPAAAHFTFSSTVPLVAGNLYVLELIQAGGFSGCGIEIPGSATVHGQPVNMNYPGGRFIFDGVPQANKDMLFREGVIVPEPGAAALCLLGALAFARRAIYPAWSLRQPPRPKP